ncbi:CRISPR-associated Cas4 family protein 3 [Thermococcus cleftensis]|uniref:CRISPR-associated exonuclease Cas4 n=1 Tax=Thermococcus cleftensis (strain DSM 27260 / KACC 17922 / CL1) TaxID=163003 RepID=I3ZWC4_THECF|nr:CRISPR-associated protein Cas4 [Thermococcus cleftensis]AFL96008.1 CRISPR-associated Cas4 family protein 3 [Thermococcus cleftensis]
MVQYYFTCERELWFFSRGLQFDFENEDMLIGRLIHGESYERGWKEVILGDVKLDVVIEGDGVEVVEVKKSSKLEEPARWQLKYYLYLLKKAGTEARGVIAYPREGKREEVVLSEEDVAIIEGAISDIERIIALETPPRAERKPYCRRCAYRDFCWV